MHCTEQAIHKLPGAYQWRKFGGIAGRQAKAPRWANVRAV